MNHAPALNPDAFDHRPARRRGTRMAVDLQRQRPARRRSAGRETTPCDWASALLPVASCSLMLGISLYHAEAVIAFIEGFL